MLYTGIRLGDYVDGSGKKWNKRDWTKQDLNKV